MKLDCGKEKFSCLFKECSYQSTRKENLRRHLQKIHGATVDYIK